jgi:hypothetical protein
MRGMATEHDIVLLAEAYAAATGNSVNTVSTKVFADGKRVNAIREGKGITLRRFNDALAWFSANWPENAVWPATVTRPFPQEAAE